MSSNCLYHLRTVNTKQYIMGWEITSQPVDNVTIFVASPPDPFMDEYNNPLYYVESGVVNYLPILATAEEIETLRRQQAIATEEEKHWVDPISGQRSRIVARDDQLIHEIAESPWNPVKKWKLKGKVGGDKEKVAELETDSENLKVRVAQLEIASEAAAEKIIQFETELEDVRKRLDKLEEK